MSEIVLRPWKISHTIADPYLERRDPPTGAWDTAFYDVAHILRPRPVRNASNFRGIVGHVEAVAAEIATLTDAELLRNANDLRAGFVGHGLRRDLVGRAFALVSETTYRRIGLRHYPVQQVGGFALLLGRMTEMETGEGKTITALLPAVTAALCGVPVHIVTVNDYLAKRDFEWLEPVYRALGLSVGLVQHGQDPLFRRNAYACDVTYCTNKELAFDYLRDRIAMRGRRVNTRVVVDHDASEADTAPPLLLRGLYFAIIDEADSVLIDEARTPLIISSQPQETDESSRYKTALRLAAELAGPRDFVISARERSAKLTAGGSEMVARFSANLDGLWRSRRAREELIEQALSALHLFERDKHYIVADDKVQIVDEFTGRVMPDRSWERGLHQLIEEKEHAEITGRRHTLAQITYQRFFRRYIWLAGMTGTAAEVAREFKSVYDLEVVRIPTNRPVRRANQGFRVFRTAGEKWDAVVTSVAQAQALRRPVLIGTRSVAASELLSERLTKSGFPHVVLNARHDSTEADIIAGAGDLAKITVATNMAGRGTDIRLAPGVVEIGGLHVILTEFHESSRIDRQLFGRAGRQGDPGTFEAIVSLEDELFRRFARRLSEACSRLPGDPSSSIPRQLGVTLRRSAQWSAEGYNFRARRETMRRSDQLDKALAFAGVAD
jgi:preprotein translocase subunit SecA